MIVRCTICVVFCATLIAEVGSAQVSRSRTQMQSRTQQQVPPHSRSAVQQRQAGARVGSPASRSAASQGGLRQVGATRTASKAEPIDPVLDRLLKEWEVASGKIQKIEGRHLRRVYDTVFKVEKRSTGVFYHEVPDKGRIDIESKPLKIPKGAKSDKLDPVTKKPFSLVGDLHEKWICDGKRIVEINEEEKTAHQIPIPPRGQGENIMNGPLPFLFGMKADIAKKRYQLALIGDPPKPNVAGQRIQIQAFPRWQTDGKNWKEARIIMEYPSFKPKAVKLVDPAGTKETVFSFAGVNTQLKDGNPFKRLIANWGPSPFRPNLRNYKVNTSAPGTGPEKPTITVPAGSQIVPAITGYEPKEAIQRLQQAGFVVSKKWSRGGPAPMKNLELKVRTSLPKPMTVVKKGATVKLVVYERQTRAAAKK